MDENGERTVHIPATGNPAEVGEADLILVFTKANRTQEVMERSLPMLGENTRVMTLQNGLGNVEAIVRLVPVERVIAGVTNFGTELLGPGKIRALGSGETRIMQADGQKTPELERICRIMNRAGMNTEITEQVWSMIWSKAVFNAALNPLSALTRLKVRDLVSNRHVMELVDGIVEEALAVAAAEGIVLDRGEIMDTIRRVGNPAMSGEHLPSMLQDVMARRPTEIDFINGQIVQRGESLGIRVPINKTLCQLIRTLEETYAKQVE